ncbi:MAG: zinc ribbon domain-containing protein, partial [Methanosarcinales archaeon]
TYSPSKETCVIGVDLGIKKCAVSVALYPDKEVKKKDIKMFKDPRRRDQINKLTQMVGKLQKQDKWKILKQLRGKRANLIKEYDHIVSKEIAEYANELSKEYNVYVIVGYPKGIRNKAYKGNYKGNNFRGKVNRWSFKRILGFIQYKCNFYGIKAIGWNENGSSIKCSICGSKNTERSYQGLLKCLDCGYQGNADLNGAVNIGTDYAVKNIKKWIKKHKD